MRIYARVDVKYNDMDTDGVVCPDVGEGEYPAYSPWHVDENDKRNPYDYHCAGSGEFCFFCEYQNGGCPDDTGSDLRRDLSEMAKSLIEGKQEPRVIARLLRETYDHNIRTFVEFCTEAGKVVRQPEWSLKSIERHLMFSTEFRGIFHSWMERSYQAMLIRVGDKLITEDGRVCGTGSKQFATLTKAYLDFQKSTAKK